MQFAFGCILTVIGVLGAILCYRALFAPVLFASRVPLIVVNLPIGVYLLHGAIAQQNALIITTPREQRRIGLSKSSDVDISTLLFGLREHLSPEIPITWEGRSY